LEECLATPGLVEAEQLFGRPEWRTYVLPPGWGDADAFWDMWKSRLAEVVLVLRRPDGRLILQSKRFYPAGAYRLPTGGIRPGEELTLAVRRETLEETGLAAEISRFLGVLCYRFQRRGEPMERASYVFLLEVGPGPLVPQDEAEQITAFREVLPSQLPAVARQLEALPGDWAIWGRFRALGHWFVAESMPDA